MEEIADRVAQWFHERYRPAHDDVARHHVHDREGDADVHEGESDGFRHATSVLARTFRAIARLDVVDRRDRCGRVRLAARLTQVVR
jgi:hypothetical protein